MRLENGREAVCEGKRRGAQAGRLGRPLPMEERTTEFGMIRGTIKKHRNREGGGNVRDSTLEVPRAWGKKRLVGARRRGMGVKGVKLRASRRGELTDRVQSSAREKMAISETVIGFWS